MTTPPPLPDQKATFTWYQQVWLGLPFALVAIGGAIGGACGGAAWALNRQVFQKTQHPVLRYLFTGLISAAAVAAYVFMAAVITLAVRKN